MIRPASVLILTSCLLLVLPGALGHGGTGSVGEDEANSREAMQVSNLTALPGSLGIHQDEIVFASPLDNGTRVGLWLVNVTAGSERLVTQIGVPASNLGFDSLAYDGRFVAWSDDRSGVLQVYVLDTQDGTFRAITDSQSDERQVALDQGVVAWSSWGEFTVKALDLETGQRYPVGAGAGAGPASAPDVFGDRVVWSKSFGGPNFEVFMRNLTTGELNRLTYDEMLQTLPSMWGDHIVWAEGYLPSSIQGSAEPNASDRPQGSRIVLKHLPSNQTADLTPNFGPFKDPVMADGWVAWKVTEPAGMAMYNLAERRVGVMPAPLGAVPDVVLSPDLLAFTLRGPAGLHVYADAPSHILGAQTQATEAGGGFTSSLPMAAAGVGLIAVGVGAEAWRRARAKDEDST